MALFAAASVMAAPAAPATPPAPAAPAAPAMPGKVELIRGSRFTYVHRLPLVDPRGERIHPGDTPALPFSLRTTCTQCHDYTEIRRGWHFNAVDPAVAPGRPGEPWFLVHRTTGTQLPLSYRAWPNTWRPSDVGLTSWRFIQMFGRHMPGGGPGEMIRTSDPEARWNLSGSLEVNCLACHSSDPEYDHIEWFAQISAQNFMWAAAAATDFATVRGAVKSMSEFYDPFLGPDGARTAAPITTYQRSKFDVRDNVFFDIPNRPPSRQCYFCHSSREVGAGAPATWKTDQDVHLARGLECVDCHRNGLNHAIRRGYEGETGSAGQPLLGTLTCRGCHLGSESAAAGPQTVGGRLGAPVPKHAGLPTIHLEKLACTTCHSGLYPGKKARRIQTSCAHALEFQGDFRGDDALPYIVEPVFARRPYDGLIGPQRMVWPAFWARVAQDKVTVLAPEAVFKTARAEFLKTPAPGEPDGLTSERIRAVLAVLATDSSAPGTPAYISGGKLYRLSRRGTLEDVDHPAAAPCAWPIAHDVRPASQSLGSGGCTDCHSADSAIYFGEVIAASPARLSPVVKTMYEFQDKDPTDLRAWALAYQFRPAFKVIGFTTVGLMAAVLALYAFLGLAALVRWIGRKAPSGRVTE